MMNQKQKYLSVNWADGMKLNKELFIAQDNAQARNAYHIAASNLSPIRYGLLPGDNNFTVTIASDNQNIARVTLLSCLAITPGGFPVQIEASEQNAGTDGNPGVSMQIEPSSSSTVYWVVLMAKPFERNPYGEVDPQENPPRFPFVKPGFEILIAGDHQISQYAGHPLALIIGKILAVGGALKPDEEFIPPCISVSASRDLLGLHAELDGFLAGLEASCSQIVQKIFRKSQQNDLSDLAQFLCDRIMLYLGEVITAFRWNYIHEPPAIMLSAMVALARIIKNTIDLRIGSGKDELMSYLCEWCELNPGELEAMLSNMAALRYNHNDINENIAAVIEFAKVIGKLFNTLSNLEFIGKKKDSGLFVKEEISSSSAENADAARPKRRFFG